MTLVPKATQKLIGELVQLYKAHQRSFETLAENLVRNIESDEVLAAEIHSIKYRAKDPKHLQRKLFAKYRRDPRHFKYTKSNFFQELNDLAGVRILHLNMRQFEKIDAGLRRVFNEQKYVLKEGPLARAWDDEFKEYFLSLGVSVQPSPKMYTSVHYVISPNTTTEKTAEIQVRTLAEEIWGEVDHQINYPKESRSPECRDQIRVLARVTSSCSRLVDSIFSTHERHEKTRRK